jgi:hypothetical protein
MTRSLGLPILLALCSLPFWSFGGPPIFGRTHRIPPHRDSVGQRKAEFGTVAVGRRADLILLTANPLEDVANVQKRGGVMVQGNWLSEDVLKAKLKRLSRINGQAKQQ